MKNPLVPTSEIFRHPMMLMSMGNNFFVIPDTTPWGAAASLGATALITVAVAREKITGREVGMPYFALATVNTITAGSLFSTAYDRFMENGHVFLEHGHNTAASGVAGIVASGGCMLVWGFGHVLRGILQRRRFDGEGGEPRNNKENPNLYTGIADMAMVIKTGLGNLAFFGLAPIVAAGISLVPKMQHVITATPDTFREYADKHITSSRVLGTTYVAMSAMMAVLHDPLHLIVATGLWAAAFVGFDPKHINDTVFSDFRHVRNLKAASP